MKDRMEIEILDDGSIKVSTDQISGPNHMNAEALQRFLAESMGGKVEKVRKGHAHKHSHSKETIDQ